MVLNIFESISKNQMNSFIINSIMNTWIMNEKYENALEIYNEFTTRSVLNEISHMYALKACMYLNDAKKGKSIMDNIKLNKINNDNLLATIINFHGHFGKYTESFYVFNIISEDKKTSVILNALMNVCLKYEYYDTMFDLYNKYNKLLNDNTYVLIIKCCMKQNDMNKGINIIKNNIDLNKCNIHLKSVLIEFLGKFAHVNIAKDVLNTVKENDKDSILIGCMMKALIINNEYKNALLLYDKYKFLQNNYLHCLAMKACIKSNDYDKGKEIALKVENSDDIYIKTTLIDLYGNLNDINKAEHIF
eukprot:211887_1